MPVFFRRGSFWRQIRRWLPPSASNIITAVLSAAGVASASFSGITIVPGVLSSAGAATSSSSGASTAAGANVAAGVAAASFVGVGVISGSLSASGAASCSFAGGSYSVMVMTASGAAVATFGTELRQIISTNMLQNPVNCVLAGEQVGFKTGRISGRALRRTFGE